MKRSCLGGLALVLAAMATVSCTANGGAIFATIEQEVKTVASNLPDTATVSTVLRVQPGVTFLAVSSTLYLGLQDLGAADATTDPNSVLTWRVIVNRFPTGSTPAYAEAAASTCRGAQLGSDGLLYAIFAIPTDTGEEIGLYRTSTAGLPALAADIAAGDVATLDWDSISPDLAGETPERFLSVNDSVGDELFIGTRRTGVLPTYGLRHYNVTSGVAASELPGAAVIQNPVSDGTFYASAYWFIAGNRVFRGALGAIVEYTDAAVASTLGFGGIHADAVSNRLYLSSRDGKLYAFDGTSWAATGAVLNDTSNDPLPFADYLSIATGASVDVYVGSEGSGFYRLPANGILAQEELAAARMPDRTISELYNGTILRFALIGDVVFACTAGAGLWHQALPDDLLPDPTAWRWE